MVSAERQLNGPQETQEVAQQTIASLTGQYNGLNLGNEAQNLINRALQQLPPGGTTRAQVDWNVRQQVADFLSSTNPLLAIQVGAGLPPQAAPAQAPSQAIAAPIVVQAQHYSLNPGVVLSDGMIQSINTIANAYHESTGQDNVVTSGTRTPAQQASAMYDKLARGDNLTTLYTNGAALGQITAAYNAGVAAGNSSAEMVASMTSVIEGQVAQGNYISNHLRENAADIRTSNMTTQQKAEFVRVAEQNGMTAIDEGDHLHIQPGR